MTEATKNPVETIAVHVPNVTLKLSDQVQIAVSEIHTASWPGVINGVLRNLNSEASRAVINLIHKNHLPEFVADTKANKDAGKVPTSTADAKVMRQAWVKAHPAEYDAMMLAAERALISTLKDGTFRIHEPAGSRSASMTPEEARARDIARAEFDDVQLPKAGYDIGRNKAGNRFAPGSKQLVNLEIKTSKGVKMYPEALESYYIKSKDRFLSDARKALANEKKAAERNVGEVSGEAVDIG